MSSLFRTRTMPTLDNNLFAFITAKCQKFRQVVSATTLSPRGVLSSCPPQSNSYIMTQFDQINDKNLKDIIWLMKSSSCCLNILPAGFFKEVSDCMTPDLLQIVNMICLSGVVSQAMNTAVVKPLHEKNNLDTPVMNNYMLVSHLPM